MSAFSPLPSTPPQPVPPPSPTSTLPLDFVHVSCIVAPIEPSPHYPLPTPLWLLFNKTNKQTKYSFIFYTMSTWRFILLESIKIVDGKKVWFFRNRLAKWQPDKQLSRWLNLWKLGKSRESHINRAYASWTSTSGLFSTDVYQAFGVACKTWYKTECSQKGKNGTIWIFPHHDALGFPK